MRIEGVPVIDVGEQQPWWTTSVRNFRTQVGQRDYPCHFGRSALMRGELFATFFTGDVSPLAVALIDFLGIARTRPGRRMVMVAFRQPDDGPPSTHEHYAAQFWDVLRELHQVDPQPWPDDYPANPEDAGWEYCFAGTPLFVFGAAPSYRRRASRNLGTGLVLTFQPRTVFHGLEANTRRGQRARATIRERLLRWDEVAPHPDLGDYGDPRNREWVQYFVADDQTTLYDRCPMRDIENGGSN